MANLNRLKAVLADSGNTNKWLAEQLDIQFVRRFLSMFKEHGINVWIDIDGLFLAMPFKKLLQKQ